MFIFLMDFPPTINIYPAANIIIFPRIVVVVVLVVVVVFCTTATVVDLVLVITFHDNYTLRQFYRLFLNVLNKRLKKRDDGMVEMVVVEGGVD